MADLGLYPLTTTEPQRISTHSVKTAVVDDRSWRQIGTRAPAVIEGVPRRSWKPGGEWLWWYFPRLVLTSRIVTTCIKASRTVLVPAQLSCSSHPLLRVERVQVKAACHMDRYSLTGPSDSNLSWESKSVPGALPQQLGAEY